MLVFVAPELQSSKETLPVVPPVFSNDQQTQLGVGVVDGVTSGVLDGDISGIVVGGGVGDSDISGIVVGGGVGDSDISGIVVGGGVGDGDGKQTVKHNSNVENIPPGTNDTHGQL